MKNEFDQKEGKKALLTSVFALMTLIVLLVIVVICLPGNGKYPWEGSVKISDVTKKQSVTIPISDSLSLVSGLEIHCRGYIDGKASLKIGYKESKVFDSGNINWSVYYDWFSPTCIIKYIPENIKNGNLIIRYKFYG